MVLPLGEERTKCCFLIGADLNRGTPDELSPIDTSARTELLRPSHMDVRRIEVSFRVDVELMHAPEPAGERAEGAP